MAIFWQEIRVGNVVIGVTLYAAVENFADDILENYSQVLTEDIAQRILPKNERR